MFGFDELANRIGTHYYQILAIPVSGNNIREMLRSWWTQTSLDNAMEMIRIMLPCLVFWEFWKERNKRVSEGTCLNFRSAISHLVASTKEPSLPI